jgi:hypothetical protein
MHTVEKSVGGAQIFAEIPRGGGRGEANAFWAYCHRVHYFWFYCIFINKCFNYLYGSPISPLTPPVGIYAINIILYDNHC